MNITSPSTDRKILYWFTIALFIFYFLFFILVFCGFKIDFLPLSPIFIVAEAVFIFLSPFVLLILAFWLRRNEAGWSKIFMNMIICFGILFLFWYTYGMFTTKQHQQTESGPLPAEYFQHPELYPEIKV
jgi:uncharacterized membrane protein YozB (DUF420 family)